MAVETKPLFNPDLIRQQVHVFTLPESIEAVRPRLQHWADLISSGKADTFKETALLPEFLSDIFGQLLGYTSPAGPGDSFTLLRETHVEVDGQFADAALGRFTTETKNTSSPSKAKARAIHWIAPLQAAACPPWSRPIATPSIFHVTGSSSPPCARRACITKAPISKPTNALRPHASPAMPHC